MSVTFSLHSVRWKVDVESSPPRVWKWDPLCGWDPWDPPVGALYQRGLRDRLIERAKAITL